MSALKEQKEQFVSGLTGGSITEIYQATSIALTSYLSYVLINNQNSNELSFPLDFLLNVITLCCSITSYSGHIGMLHLMVITPALVAVLIGNGKKILKTRGLAKRKANHSKDKGSGSDPFSQKLPKKPFITAYRSYMLIITNLCILAVDFPIFPRRFAKVETWGTSMMDLGVGSFVFSMGLVNSRSVLKRLLYSKYKFTWSNYLGLIKNNTVKAIPVLVLGLIRLASVKSLDYQEHVTEYGTHWNFFITLGLLPVFVGILDPILNTIPREIVAFAIALGYELALNETPLLEYILKTDNRFANIITMNKEGIFSFFGYLSIFLFGQSFGSFALTSDTVETGIKNGLFGTNTRRGLISTSILYQGIFLLARYVPLFSNVSRRLANFQYVIWVVSYNAIFLLGFDMIETHVSVREATSQLLDAINKNGLMIFLVSNLLTGLVNMTINTLECGNTAAFGVLTCYSIVFSALAVILDKNNIYIKL
ncbi:uncharacterized protein PRCAT00004150001 [Priceomyces carsonii]|uniref:uncharacterized protein n=1 Tax=Priceomyces carsonii TaxID=28549 RepID=UPI002ED7D8B5|nr:unnamed protein product [Priceomyces carsonii]